MTESRTEYLLRIAAGFIRQYAPEDTMLYDGAVCDGYCLADDLDAERADLEDKRFDRRFEQA